MAKCKKNFWNSRNDTPEPDWYAREKDPLDRLGGFKGEHNPRPEGARIPRAIVGDREVSIKEAFEIYKAHNMESFRLNFAHFKTSLINGTKLKTAKGIISKPEGV